MLENLGRGAGEDVGGRQETALVGYRGFDGVRYRCQDNSDYWFHFAIPTPVIDDGVRARLRKVMVLFSAGTGVILNSIQVWDGPNHVFTKDGIGVGGTNTQIIDGRNAFPLPDQEVAWGIGVSLQFHFADAAGVTLHTAGVDFEC